MGTTASNDFFTFLVSKPSNLAIIAISGLLQVSVIPLAVYGIIWYPFYEVSFFSEKFSDQFCILQTQMDNIPYKNNKKLFSDKIHKSTYLNLAHMSLICP
jgi:hypothetical protein